MYKVHLALFFVTAIYGATFTLAKEVMPEYSGPFGLILVRVLVAFVLFWIYQKILSGEKVRDRKDYVRLFLCAFFGVACNMLLFFKGLSITHPVNAALIMSMTPVFVMLIAALSRVEKLTLSKGAGIVLGATGAALIIGSPRIDADVGHWTGDLLVMINACSYAVYLVMVKPLMQKYEPVTVVRWTFFFGSLMVLPFGWQEFTEVQWSEMPADIWLAIAFIVIGTTFLAYLLNAWALQKVNASVVGSYIYLQPVLAAFIAVLFAGYVLTPGQVFYAVFIFTGVYLVSR